MLIALTVDWSLIPYLLSAVFTRDFLVQQSEWFGIVCACLVVVIVVLTEFPLLPCLLVVLQSLCLSFVLAHSTDCIRVQAKRPARTEDVSDEDGVMISVRASKKLRSVDLGALADKESKSAIKSKYALALLKIFPVWLIYYFVYRAIRTPTGSPIKKKIERYVLLLYPVGCVDAWNYTVYLWLSFLMMTMMSLLSH